MRRTRAPEHGFTIVELSVTIMILGVVVASLLGVFLSFQRSQAFITDRSEGLDNLRVAMDKLTKELRQATSVSSSSTGSSITFSTYINGTPATVTWAYSSGTLTRTSGTVTLTMLNAVQSSALFTYTPSVAVPNIVKVDLTTTPMHAPATVLQLESEVRLRNM